MLSYSCPMIRSFNFGNFIIKSHEMTSYGLLGVLIGCNFLYGLCLTGLFFLAIWTFIYHFPCNSPNPINDVFFLQSCYQCRSSIMSLCKVPVKFLYKLFRNVSWNIYCFLIG